MKKYLISVIISIQSVKKCFTDCLKSIEKQTYKNLEIIIIDNTNDSNIRKIYTDFADSDNRVKIIKTSKSDIHNIALENSTGDFIHFISSCDYISPSYYEKMLQSAIKHNSDVAISGFKSARTEHIYNKKDVATDISDKVKISNIYKYDYIFRYLLRRKFLTDNNIKFKTDSMQDMVFLMQIVFYADNIITVPHITYFTNL